MSEDDELGFFLSKKINTLAALLYQSNGREFRPDIDFQESSHPEEYGCWNKAVIAYSFINEDPSLLKHQV
jgi:hypothetical protein